MPNKTRKDAHNRVMLAKTGSHVDATDKYLVTLRAKLREWIAEIDEELIVRAEPIRERVCPCCGGPRTEHERALDWACSDCRTADARHV
jgi:ribosomal protein L37AE/L43A